MSSTFTLSLPCKPKQEQATLYKNDHNAFGIFTFRSMSLETDVDMIHNWVNKEYTKRFWGLAGTRELVYNTYKMLLEHPHGHSFIGELNGEPVCQVDCYQVLADELAQHVPEATLKDCGIHLLMAPAQKRQPGLTEFVLRSFIKYYFSFEQSGDLYGEPDKENIAVTKLVKKIGFQFLRQIEMSYKTANLWVLKRENLQ